MLRRIIKLRHLRKPIMKLGFCEWVIIKNVKLCRLRKNLVIAGIGAFISSAVGGVMIAFIVAFFSCVLEEVYDMGIYDKKFSLNIETLSVMLSKSFSLNSFRELKHPIDNMPANAPALETSATENSKEFSNAYKHAS